MKTFKLYLVFSLITILSLMITPSLALSKGKYVVLSYGALSCGRYVSTSSTQASLEKIGFNGWALGFMTAYNLWANSNKEDVTEHIDNKGLELWLDNYCKVNPLATFDRAVLELIKTLEKQKQ